MTQAISLPVFPSRTNLKLHNISGTPKMVKKVIRSLDSAKALGVIIFLWWVERSLCLDFLAY